MEDVNVRALSGSVLEIVREREPFSIQSSVGYEKAHTEPYLKAEPMVQSNHPKIRAAVSELKQR
jgi:hypothetical protein